MLIPLFGFKRKRFFQFKVRPTNRDPEMANTPGNEPSLESAGAAAVLHAPPTSTYQAWSRSFVEMYTIAHEWTIENFIELDEEASVCFKVKLSLEFSRHRNSV